LKTRYAHYIILFLILVFAGGCKTARQLTSVNYSPEAKRTAAQISSTGSLLEAKRMMLNGDLKLAVDQLNKAIKENPENDAAYYEMSRVFQYVGGNRNYKKALEYGKKAVELAPNNYWYHQNIIGIYKKTGDFENAAKEARVVKDLYPNRKEAYYQLANMYIRGKELKQALKVYQEIEQHFGFDEGVVKQRKQIYLSMGDYNKALKEIDHLIEHDPQNTRYYGMAADIYMDRGQYDKAFAYYQKILQIDPQNGRVHLALADYYRIQGDTQKSYDETLKAMGCPKLDIDTKVKVLVGFFQQSDQDELAKKRTYRLLDTVVAVHPNEPKALAMKADFLNREGKYTEALDYFHRVIALDSSRYLVWEQMLLVEQRLNKYEMMARESERALHLFPQQANLYYFNGLSNLKIKNYAQAEKTLKMGLNFVFDDKTKSDFYAMMAEAEFRQHKFGPAEDHFDMAVKLNPLNATALKDYAYFLAYNGKNIAGAKTMAEKALELKSNDPEFIYTYAFVLFKNGEKDAANRWVKDAIKKFPDNKKLRLLDQEINKNE